MRTAHVGRNDKNRAWQGPRLYWDCSMTSQSTSQAGIQRVVRNITAGAAAISRENGYESRLVVFRDGRWREVPTALDRVRRNEPSNDARHEKGGDSPLGYWTRRLADRLYKIAYPRTLVRVARRVSLNALGKGEPIPDFRADDILVLLDGSWLMSESPRLEAARRAGTRIGLVVYDLLPISHPQFMLPKARRQFSRWMRRIVPQTDFFLAISKTICDEFRSWARQEFPAKRLTDDQVSWFPLGVKLDLVSTAGEVRPALRAAFDKSCPTYLKVSTLDPRKNHVAILDAFESVWQESPATRLCFAGRQGWMCGELVRRIQDHPRRGQQLFWFSDLTDAELSFCFRSAAGTIYASFAEGYGLPIAESLQYGLPTFVSDIPVHREVGGEFCAWFDPRQSESLARLISAHVRTGEFPAQRHPDEYCPTTWDESTRVLIDECQRLARQVRGGRLEHRDSSKQPETASDPSPSLVGGDG